MEPSETIAVSDGETLDGRPAVGGGTVDFHLKAEINLLRSLRPPGLGCIVICVSPHMLIYT